jgi:uncharacterized protein YuzB (UPF0349 family)
VADLLTKGFRRRSGQYWREALERLGKHPTPIGFPKYGYLLQADDSIVGVILLIFTTIETGIDRVTRCNVSSWYVDAAFRIYATLLTSQAFKYKDVTYLNISPAAHVQPIIQAQGFSRYCNGQFCALPILSRPSVHTEVRVLSVSKCSDEHFAPFERDLLLSHIEYGCIVVCCATSQCAYPFVFMPRVVKGLIPCAQLIYCRQIKDLIRLARPIGRFLALQGRPLVLIDSNGPIPGLVGMYFNGVSPKYFRGPHPPRLGDLAYTEAAIFGI